MAKNYFIIRSNKDLVNVYNAIVLWFKGKQYDVEGTEKNNIYFIQARKTHLIRTMMGANMAFKIKIYLSEDKALTSKEFIIETTRGKWIQNIAGAGFSALFTAGLTLLTGMASAGWSLLLENELISYLENDLNFPRVKPEIPTQQSSQKVTENVNSYQINLAKNSDQKKIIADLEEEINRLEIAFTDEILTEGEFSRKKALLERQIDDYEVNFVIEERVKKLQEAFTQGILDQVEFEEKVRELEANLRKEILEDRKLERNKSRIIKLKQALDNGIITRQEYQQKMSEF